MRHLLARTALVTLAGTGLNAQAADPIFWFSDTPYLSAADIPTGFYAGGNATLLETLEDGSLDATLAADRGSLIGPGAFNGGRDSVDGDDGVIDGTCGPQSSACHSGFDGNGAQGTRFTPAVARCPPPSSWSGPTPRPAPASPSAPSAPTASRWAASASAASPMAATAPPPAKTASSASPSTAA